MTRTSGGAKRQDDSKQFHIKRLEGYRAAVKGLSRESNWYSPVRPGGEDEEAWFDGFDLAIADMKGGASR